MAYQIRLNGKSFELMGFRFPDDSPNREWFDDGMPPALLLKTDRKELREHFTLISPAKPVLMHIDTLDGEKTVAIVKITHIKFVRDGRFKHPEKAKCWIELEPETPYEAVIRHIGTAELTKMRTHH